MGKSLIIVESPAKIKTLKKFLGKDFKLESSIGHIRDLPQKGFGIDIENDFEPKYEVMEDKKTVVAKLKKAAKECDVVYLAPDPDREGEAIAWHIASLLPKKTKIKRITFNSITKDAVLEAIDTPRDIDLALVNAQQARRFLDRIVGYKISPILQRKLKRGKLGGVSAGRVQSIALKFVVDREKEIDAFEPVEYWSINSMLSPTKEKDKFAASIHSVDGKKVEKEKSGPKTTTISNKKEADRLTKLLKDASFTVASIDKKEKKRRAPPPFITSTLQQEAYRHYGFASNRTMGIAQSLYEGIDLGKDGQEGLITYMRTDSVRIAPEAVTAARGYIAKKHGKEYLPEKGQQFTRKKSAQDAHEAIRPTNLNRPPELVKKYLTDDQFKLYMLVWRRFVACQMTPALYDTASCDIETDKNIILRATGSIMKFPGYLAVYQEKEDEEAKEEGRILPPLEVGKALNLLNLDSVQSFTKPPPRYTEASLVKELEKSGIGRPSTYAATMNKIQGRAYTTKEKQRLHPTELGKIVAAMLETHFDVIMDVAFTADMEDALDEIAAHTKDWKAFLNEFWKKFEPIVEKGIKEAHVPKILTEIDCPKCGNKLHKIWSKTKYFYGCSNYPDCDFTVPIEALEFDKSEYAENFNWDQDCPKCKAPMLIRFGRFGAFLGCSKYPDCNGIVNIPKKGEALLEDMPDCPAIGCDGKIQKRQSRFGKTFFSCSNYPDCDVIVNELDKLEKKYPDHPKTAYVKKAGGKGGGRGGAFKVSKELEAVIGVKEVTRGDATKKIWIYIKEHNLQNPDNKRQIVPDEKMSKVFGHKEPVDMMKLGGIMSKHLSR